MTLDSITAFFGWCSVVNIGVLTLATLMLMVFRRPVIGLHSRLFGVSEADLSLIYFRFLAHYKLLIYVFNLVPWLVLKFLV